MKNLVRYLLENRMHLPREHWTMQGFGFLRLRIDDSTRLHIWDSRLRVPGVSDIHDHTQWAFTSHVISGSIINIRYTIDPDGQPHNMAVLNCGIGGGMQTALPEAVVLRIGTPELYLPGSSYHQEPDEIHRTTASDGTVTLLKQDRRETDTARVFWPVGGTWVNAIPRTAKEWEINEVGAFALSIFNAETTSARRVP